MPDPDVPPSARSGRPLVIGLLSTIVVVGLVAAILILQTPRQLVNPTPVDALASSTDTCVTCHRSASPGIVTQFSHSSMAANKVSCRDCHEVAASFPGAVAHQGSYITNHPTTAMCQKCHQAETAQFQQSRHAAPAWVAYAGSASLTQAQTAVYQSIPEGQYSPSKARNAIGALEGAQITQFACETCHSVGQPQVDGSIGDCVKCHQRHEFSLEQARKPETCNACHIGPDHPQWEIYQESPHGIAYATSGANWNWNAEPGTLTVSDFPAPTCATCHFSGFGASGTTHDVGDRLTWYLFAPVSDRRPAYQDNKTRMQSVCLECHNKNFVDDFYARADQGTDAVNQKVKSGDTIMAPLTAAKLLTDKPFDQPIEFQYFELWHHWGRTAKFGMWMQGPDYTQWHGAYEMEKALVNLQDMAGQLLNPAQAGK
jgi:hydroxylamine dehydrogenase